MAKLEVLITDLRLRKSPSLSGKILGFVEKGIHEYTDTTRADGFLWYHVENGYIAAVEGSIKEIAEDKPQPVKRDTNKDQIYVGNFILNMRKEPTTKSSKVGACESNSYYNVLEISKQSDYTWYKLGEGYWGAGVPELVYYQAGSTEEGEALKKEISSTEDSFKLVLDCISQNVGSKYYVELTEKLKDVNKFVADNFDTFEYDLVDEHEYDEIDLLYTADVHGAWVGYDEDGNYQNPIFNYDDVANYRTKLKNKNIKALLVDCGDWSRPCRVYDDYINTGRMISAEQMNSKDYFVSVYGNHEWRWMLNEGMSTEDVLNKSKSITACNLFKNGKLMYKPYRTAKIGSKKIGVIGVGYPSPNGAGSYSNGEWKFNEYTILDDVKLFNQVQKYINELKANNFDYIVVVSHMCKSSYESDSRYVARTDSLIKNTSGLTAVLQGHYNFATNAESITDKSGRAVLLAHESGSNMNSFGRLQLKPGRTTSYLLDERSDLNVI